MNIQDSFLSRADKKTRHGMAFFWLVGIAITVGMSVNLAVAEENLELTKALDLNKQVVQLYRSGRYNDAMAFAKEALAIREKVLGADHPDTATSLDNLAGLYKSLGNYGAAEPLFERALEMREKVLGADDPDTAMSLNNLAGLYLSMGNYGKAEPLYERALAICEKALEADHPYTATSLNNLAVLCKLMGNYEKAEPLYERALAIKEKVLGTDHPDTAMSLNNLAGLYFSMRNYGKAKPLYERVLTIREKALGADHLDTAASLNNLASLYESVSNADKAEPLYERALAIYEKALGANHPLTATSLNNLAEFFSSQGNYDKAEPLYERALSIYEKALGANHPDTATTLNNLAWLYFSQGNYEKAEPLYERALSIYEKALGADHPDTATTLNNLAFLQLDREKPIEALKLAERAEHAGEKTLANIFSFSSEQQRGEFQKTQYPYNLPATLGNAPLIALTLLHWKGVVLDSVLEDLTLARAARVKGLGAQLEAIKSLQSQLRKLAMEAPKDISEAGLRARTQEREKLNAEMEKLESALARKVSALGQSRRALTVTAAQVQAALGAQETLVEFICYSHYLGKNKWERRYGAVIFAPKAAVQWVALGGAGAIEKAIRLYQKSARGKTDETTLQTVLRELHGRIWAPIEKALPENIRSVILSPDGELNFVSFATLLGEDNRFLAEKYALRYVSSGRDLLPSPSRDAAPAKQAIELYGNPDFLLAKVDRSPPSRKATEVAMRESEIRDFRDVNLRPLAGTAAECMDLAKMAKKNGGLVEVRTGPEATEAGLQTLQSPRVLHLATHGFFLPEIEIGEAAPSLGQRRDIPRGKLLNPMHRSGLALAGAQNTLEAWGRGEVPDSENDGILTAEEVGMLHLAGTWLVTLSACETGSGQARAGEGVLGLRRGFIQAGAENLLMTLWPISDETTVKIMLEFYASAFGGEAAPQALFEVQRKWLLKVRQEQGLQAAVNLVGPFIMSSQGKTHP